MIDTLHSPIILGHPWMVIHNPELDCKRHEILGWSPVCWTRCLLKVHSPASAPRLEEAPNFAKVPVEYHDLKEVFCNSPATCLPPHRPYDCAIDLKPGTTPPRGCLFLRSQPETEAIEKYLREALTTGIIRPSSSPAGAGFSFLGKKDGSLCLSINYWGINDIKNRYPLPLMTTVFKLLQEATTFTKLDLCNAYHLVWIREEDEWKEAFNTPTGHWEYLGKPFGLTNAPAVNDVLWNMNNQFVFVYLDDILMFSKSPEEYTTHVRIVLRHLLENRLFVKAEKCKFFFRLLGIHNLYWKHQYVSREGLSGRGVAQTHGSQGLTTFPRVC